MSVTAKLLAFLAHIDGRDKYLKVFQYGVKSGVISAGDSLKTKENAEVLRRLNLFVSSLSAARKVMRLGNWIDGYAKLRMLAKEGMSWSELFWQIVDIIGSVTGMFCNFFEDMGTLCGIGVLPGKDRDRYDTWASWLWLVGIIVNISTNFRDTRELILEEWALIRKRKQLDTRLAQLNQALVERTLAAEQEARQRDRERELAAQLKLHSQQQQMDMEVEAGGRADSITTPVARNKQQQQQQEQVVDSPNFFTQLWERAAGEDSPPDSDTEDETESRGDPLSFSRIGHANLIDPKTFGARQCRLPEQGPAPVPPLPAPQSLPPLLPQTPSSSSGVNASISAPSPLQASSASAVCTPSSARTRTPSRMDPLEEDPQALSTLIEAAHKDAAATETRKREVLALRLALHVNLAKLSADTVFCMFDLNKPMAAARPLVPAISALISALIGTKQRWDKSK